MGYYEEDFYNEPSEFEIAVEQFKEELSKAVKEEYIEEMKRLREENNSLQVIKKDFESIKNEYKNKERELEYERQQLLNKVRRERLAELMKDFQVVMYQARNRKQELPKCNNCDERRQIKYTTPLGKEKYESCECNNGKYVYVPEEYIATEFKINDRNGKEMRVWFKPTAERDYDYFSYASSTYFEKTYEEGMKFEELDKYGVFFKTEEECQLYCDHLNVNEEENIN